MPASTSRIRSLSWIGRPADAERAHAVGEPVVALLLLLGRELVGHHRAPPTTRGRRPRRRRRRGRRGVVPSSTAAVSGVVRFVVITSASQAVAWSLPGGAGGGHGGEHVVGQLRAARARRAGRGAAPTATRSGGQGARRGSRRRLSRRRRRPRRSAEISGVGVANPGSPSELEPGTIVPGSNARQRRWDGMSNAGNGGVASDGHRGRRDPDRGEVVLGEEVDGVRRAGRGSA